MPKRPENTGYAQGTNGQFCMGIPCRDTLPKNAILHWETLHTGYPRVTTFPKKEELINKGIGQQIHVHSSKVFEMVALMPCSRNSAKHHA